MIVMASTPSIFCILGLPVEQAVVTQGRGRAGPPSEANSWGLRPKMRVVFSLPNQEVEAIWYRGTVRKDGQEYYYQELKYAQLPTDSNYWKEQFQSEQPKWHSPPLDTWEDFAALRTFRPCPPPEGISSKHESKSGKYFEFDYYPCSFGLEVGFTHTKMELQLQIAKAKPEVESQSPSYHPGHYWEEDSNNWSVAEKWGTLIIYQGKEKDILQRIEDMREQEKLVLDGHTKDVEGRLKTAS
jgi:hypothetical protein